MLKPSSQKISIRGEVRSAASLRRSSTSETPRERPASRLLPASGRQRCRLKLRTAIGRSRPVTIRLDVRDIERAEKHSVAKGLKYQTYIKMLLHEGVGGAIGVRELRAQAPFPPPPPRGRNNIPASSRQSEIQTT